MTLDINSTQQSEDSTILRRPQVEAMIGLKRASSYVRIAAGLLPQPVKIGSRVSGWPAREITSVNEAIIAGKTDAEIRQLVTDLVGRRNGRGGE